MIRISSEELSSFHQCPEDAGQMVDVQYAIARDHEMLVCRTTDRSSRTTTYECAELNYNKDCTFEPWNGRLPSTYGSWESCNVI